jgi:hypothetical protein
VIYDAVAFLSFRMSGPVLGSTGHFVVYHVELIAITIAFLISRAFAIHAMKMLAWCGNGKVGLLDKLATSECSQESEGDYFLSMILIVALVMVVTGMVR